MARYSEVCNNRTGRIYINPKLKININYCLILRNKRTLSVYNVIIEDTWKHVLRYFWWKVL